MSTLWAGRFSKDSDQLMVDFHSSIHFDQTLYYWDIRGSQAHARMLESVGLLTDAECGAIVEGLEGILVDIEAGRVTFNPQDEDIHMNIERLLTERIGEAGKKLHTGRSRNDQVAVDVRMYLRHEVQETTDYLLALIGVLLDKAEREIDIIMPGYTHLQRAQPIRWAHHLLAYVDMLGRDVQSLRDWLVQHNVMPLGSGALAGTTFPLDREHTARALGFACPCFNSLDGVSDRDALLDYLYVASRSMMHLSRLCEEVILWSSQEFGFVTLDDAYSTGSSIMPQKKNPDVAELVRGKTGRVYGNLVALLTTMKALPLAYNKDMQEDKEGLFDTVTTWKQCLAIMTPMLATMVVHGDVMRAATKKGFANATDLADYLAKKGIPFRDAHRIVGEMVAECLTRGCALEDLEIHEMKQYDAAIEEDIYTALDIEQCVEGRNTMGGPNRQRVEHAIRTHRIWLGMQEAVPRVGDV